MHRKPDLAIITLVTTRASDLKCFVCFCKLLGRILRPTGLLCDTARDSQIDPPRETRLQAMETPSSRKYPPFRPTVVHANMSTLR